MLPSSSGKRSKAFLRGRPKVEGTAGETPAPAYWDEVKAGRTNKPIHNDEGLPFIVTKIS